MSVFRTLNPKIFQKNYLLQIHEDTLHKSLIFSSFFARTLNSSPQIDPGTGNTSSRSNTRLSFLFQQGSETEGENENSELRGKSRKLENEIRVLKHKSGSRGEKKKESEESEPTRRMSELFIAKKQDREMKLKLKEEEPGISKEVFYMKLSPNAENFIRHLYNQGYLNQASFLRNGKLDFGCIDGDYGREFLYHAADKFGRNHQEIAKWVSGSNLKPVALFGCPSLSKKSVFSAKKLRKFFKIEEQTVCSKCVLKDSCKHANQSVWGGVGIKSLSLSDVMRVIFLYALDKTHPDLTVPDEIKDLVAYLLKEIVKLSRTTSI